MICVRDKSATTLSGTCPGLCRKVGVMEFGLYTFKPELIRLSYCLWTVGQLAYIVSK